MFNTVASRLIFSEIKREYGAHILQQARSLEGNCLKLTNFKCKLSFLVACRDTGSLPKYLRLKWEHKKKSSAARNLWNVGVTLLNLTIRDHHQNIVILTNQIGTSVLRLKSSLDEQNMNVLQEHIAFLQYVTYSHKLKIIEKFMQLVCERNCCFVNSHRRATMQKEATVSFIGPQLSDIEKSALHNGLNVALPAKLISYFKFMSCIEESLQKVEINEQLHSPERHTLKQLKEREDIFITEADKGNAAVVLPKEEYVNKVVPPSIHAISSEKQECLSPKTEKR
uniref:Uncharacterized protein n=1 Tax=Trichuris muris TaxID=70415 RepID=A0A5S6QGA5_TRIMR